MAKSFGRRPVTDVTKPAPKMTYFWDGEERIDRRPLGRAVERFVDPQGNVVSLQLAGDGDSQRQMSIDRNRMERRRDGFVEHAKCPLRHGTHLTPGATGIDFSAMPQSLRDPCASDSKTLVKRGFEIHATQSCPHIEWLIEHRREKERVQAAKRNEQRMADEARLREKQELERLQLEMVREQLEERRAKKTKQVKE